MSERIYILDSTAFYAGIPFQGEGRYYSTYQVLEEVKHQKFTSQFIHSRVQILEPSKESLQKVREIAIKTGDSKSISDADSSIIALSLDLSLSRKDESVILVTDDFAIRNVAELLGINLSKTTIKGEWKNIVWITYCKGCGKEYPGSQATVCDVCGTKLSRKPSTTHLA